MTTHEVFRQIGTIIYLDEDPPTLGEVAWRREGGLQGPEGQTFMAVYEDRKPLYFRYADHVIDCRGKTADEIVTEITEILDDE